ncbi:HIT family protein [Candidatus Woesearchaeota archaeon]|nr:HIT family protein [Candidatus Woesearchaeota archaeon]
MADDCIFCKIIAGDIPCNKIGENDDFLCFLDIKPITDGHALIVPKKHFKDVMEFPKELDEGYFAFCQEMAKKIVGTVKADGFNLGMNNGRAAGQIIFHQHTHLIPRFDDDKLESWPHKEITLEELGELQERILKS